MTDPTLYLVQSDVGLEAAFRKCENCGEFFELQGPPDEDRRLTCDLSCYRAISGEL